MNNNRCRVSAGSCTGKIKKTSFQSSTPAGKSDESRLGLFSSARQSSTVEQESMDPFNDSCCGCSHWTSRRMKNENSTTIRQDSSDSEIDVDELTQVKAVVTPSETHTKPPDPPSAASTFTVANEDDEDLSGSSYSTLTSADFAVEGIDFINFFFQNFGRLQKENEAAAAGSNENASINCSPVPKTLDNETGARYRTPDQCEDKSYFQRKFNIRPKIPDYPLNLDGSLDGGPVCSSSVGSDTSKSSEVIACQDHIIESVPAVPVNSPNGTVDIGSSSSSVDQQNQMKLRSTDNQKEQELFDQQTQMSTTAMYENSTANSTASCWRPCDDRPPCVGQEYSPERNVSCIGQESSSFSLSDREQSFLPGLHSTCCKTYRNSGSNDVNGLSGPNVGDCTPMREEVDPCSVNPPSPVIKSSSMKVHLWLQHMNANLDQCCSNQPRAVDNTVHQSCAASGVCNNVCRRFDRPADMLDHSEHRHANRHHHASSSVSTKCNSRQVIKRKLDAGVGSVNQKCDHSCSKHSKISKPCQSTTRAANSASKHTRHSSSKGRSEVGKSRHAVHCGAGRIDKTVLHSNTRTHKAESSSHYQATSATYMEQAALFHPRRDIHGARFGKRDSLQLQNHPSIPNALLQTQNLVDENESRMQISDFPMHRNSTKPSACMPGAADVSMSSDATAFMHRGMTRGKPVCTKPLASKNRRHISKRLQEFGHYIRKHSKLSTSIRMHTLAIVWV